VFEPGGAPKQWSVPAQRGAPPTTFPIPLPAPVTAPRDGHHDWGAVVAVLAVMIALAGLAGPGTSVADLDRAPAGVASLR
jgi:hypothetical protein